MGKKSLLSLIMLFSVTCLLPLAAWAEDSISWMESATPPFFIHEGVFKGQGYVEVINNILIENLPEYSHTRTIANLTRHYQQWKQGEKACAPSMYKTDERKKFVYFSIPSTFSLPIELIIDKKNFVAFGGSKTVNIANILQSSFLMMSVIDKQRILSDSTVLQK